MQLTTEQEARVTFNVNAFGDAFSQDHTDLRCHQVCAVIRREMADESVPLGHPQLRAQLDWIDRILDRILARRKSTITHIASNLQHSMAGHLH
jgi:hypothetical protein